MPSAVILSRSMQEGFALGATLCEDRGAELASPGLSPRIRSQATALSRELQALDSAARRRFVRDLMHRRFARPHLTPPRTPEPDPRAPARALSLLAPLVPRELGERWLSGAPLPRPGYTPSPQLVRLLARQLLGSGAGGD